MTAIAMICTKVSEHPNADALKMYEFQYDKETLQVVANLENVYEVGDVVAIVRSGSIMLDGTKIKDSTIRGVRSYGMALGKTEDPAGTDLTSKYCQEMPVDTNHISHVPWPDIESLFNVRKYLVQNNTAKTVTYRARVKLDGTNCGISLPPSDSDGKKVIAQSRSRIVTTTSDNMNFAKWTSLRYDFFLNVRDNADKLGIKDHIIVFAEFCGQGIQKRTAISKIDKQIIAVFAIQIGLKESAKFETDPDKIKEILFSNEKNWNVSPDVYVLPWYGDRIDLNYASPEELQSGADVINNMVEEVEKCDPWVSETFGINGLGEGVVMYPIINNSTLVNRGDYVDLVFKAKGEKHKVVNTKKPAQINPEFVATVDAFVDLMVTENRLEQIAQKVGGFDKKATGAFLKEFSQDVIKESTAELEDSGLEWRQVAKAVNEKAKTWWIGKCNE